MKIQTSKSSSTSTSDVGGKKRSVGFTAGMLVGLTFGLLLSNLKGELKELATSATAAAAANNKTSSKSILSSSHQTMTGSDEKKSNDNDDGWKQIEVFYGNSSHLDLGGDVNKQWVSQVKQDETVWNLLGQLEGGYFIELASNDATLISNSYALETYHGWNGLCMEANPKYWSRLAYRKCTVVGAVVGASRMEEMEFAFGRRKEDLQIRLVAGSTYDDAVLGGIVRTDFDNRNSMKDENTPLSAKRYTVPLAEIFERYAVPKVIDYFSLDVEGAESFVMSTFPFDKYTFRVLTIERPKPDLQKLLKSKGYVYLQSVSDWGEQVWHHPNYTTSQ